MILLGFNRDCEVEIYAGFNMEIWDKDISYSHALVEDLTEAWRVAHSLPIAAPWGRIVYSPTWAGTINVST